jgi:hypothetical protein
MFSWWGGRVVRWRWGVLATGFAFVVFAALWGTSVFGSLVSGGFDNPKSESAIAANLVSTKLGRNTADIVVLVRNPDVTGTVRPTGQLSLRSRRTYPGTTSVVLRLTGRRARRTSSAETGTPPTSPLPRPTPTQPSISQITIDSRRVRPAPATRCRSAAKKHSTPR